MGKFKCTHCGKDDFRSKKGLSQHLLTKLPCRDKEKARLTSRKSEESQLSYDMAQAQQQQGINSDNESIMQPNPNRLEQDSDEGVGTIAARLRRRKKREESPMDEDSNDFPTGVEVTIGVTRPTILRVRTPWVHGAPNTPTLLRIWTPTMMRVRNPRILGLPQQRQRIPVEWYAPSMSIVTHPPNHWSCRDLNVLVYD